MPRVPLVSCLFTLAAITIAAAEPRVIDAKSHHLGLAGEREWHDLDGTTPEGQSLQITFEAKKNEEAATLLIRQRDVKVRWPVLLNGRRLGTLDPLEYQQVTSFTLPQGSLRDGENSLSVISMERPDDIFIEEIRFDPRPPELALREGLVRVQVKDAESQNPLPCRITIADDRGALAALSALPGQTLAVRSGTIYTGNGAVEFGLPRGEYTIYASRGFEYGAAAKKVKIEPGSSEEVALTIAREVDTAGLVACDTHIHTFTYSKHGDATADERVLTIPGEGIELAVAADHNIHVDYSDRATVLNVADHFTYVRANEVTTPTGHFIAFPIADTSAPLPDSKLTDWTELMRSIRGVPDVKVIILNHPRDMHSKFIPFAPENFDSVTGANLRGGKFEFDAMELCNSGALQSDFMRVFRDWFALLNRGYRITAVGSSDSHDVSRSIVGQGRTYIACDDRVPGKVPIKVACENLKAGRASVSLGLLVKLQVNGQFTNGDLATIKEKEMSVKVQVLGPSWATADRVELFANGLKIREEKIASESKSGKAGVKAELQWRLPRFPHDVHLVAIASGPPVTAPFWEIQTPYQPTDRIRDRRAFAATNPVWLDCDGNGKFTAARGYAEELIGKVGTAPGKLVPALAKFDEAVAIQAAGLCRETVTDLNQSEFTQALANAPEAVRRGFEAVRSR